MRSADSGISARSMIAALENTGYFHVVQRPAAESEAEELLLRGEVQFVITIPRLHGPMFGNLPLLFVIVLLFITRT